MTVSDALQYSIRVELFAFNVQKSDNPYFPLHMDSVLMILCLSDFSPFITRCRIKHFFLHIHEIFLLLLGLQKQGHIIELNNFNLLLKWIISC